MNTPTAQEVRRWAREVGIVVGRRGRLSPATVDAFRAAHAVDRRPVSSAAIRSGRRIAAKPNVAGGQRGRTVKARKD